MNTICVGCARPVIGVSVTKLGGGWFATVTATGLEVAMFWDASRAVAVSVCGPFATGAVSQLRPEGRGVLGTEVLPVELELDAGDAESSDALAVTAIVPERVLFAAGAMSCTEGGVVSQAVVAALMLVARAVSGLVERVHCDGVLVPQASPEVADVVGEVPVWAPLL